MGGAPRGCRRRPAPARALALIAAELFGAILAPALLVFNSPMGGSVGPDGNNDSQDVRFLQSLINDSRDSTGGSLITVDGSFSEETAGALAEFQAASGLEDTGGSLTPGDATETALETTPPGQRLRRGGSGRDAAGRPRRVRLPGGSGRRRPRVGGGARPANGVQRFRPASTRRTCATTSRKRAGAVRWTSCRSRSRSTSKVRSRRRCRPWEGQAAP
ncbi:peptidoglycan-binding domain-containing protein [Streptomyces sp. NPDC002935]|uniref:peptidoglycan-binding domain-containing protein n=1 Tax=Streptomyces sp. NPDC002935 TaxID=3154545 RepID=UPI0033B13EA6